MEGSPRDVLQESFARCDYIIFLDINTFARLFRVFRRWLRQRTGKESYNSRPTLRFLYANILWVGEFNQKRTQIISLLSAYGEKWKRFTDEEAVLDFVAEKYGQGEKCFFRIFTWHLKRLKGKILENGEIEYGDF